MKSLEELQKIIEAEIECRSRQMLQQNPQELYEPINYSLEMGGKRLRPVLLLLAYNLFSKDISAAVPAALAIEVFHNFTLLHDDIMDKADVRRNHQTVHRKFSENSAILSGDAMAFQSYKYLLESKSPRLPEVIQLFTQTAIEVCEGQQYDMDFENRLDVSVSEYLEMIRLKTAVLLACSLKAGALLAESSNDVANKLYDFGINLGLSFQLQDDWLDTFGNQDTFGKKIGGDILANKKTYLLIHALEKANEIQRSELMFWLEKKEFDADEKISAVTTIYKQLGIKGITSDSVDFYFQKSMEQLERIPLDNVVKQHLKNLANKMLTRKH